MNEKLRIAMLVSGGGTTMQAIIQACHNGILKKVDPVLVIASRSDAGAIHKALAEGLSTINIVVINPKHYYNCLKKFSERILEECHKHHVDFIGQYGWMVKTPPNIIAKYRNMMVNQHPGPLDSGRPDFGGQGMYGLRVHAARLYFVQMVNRDYWTEATAQRVASEYDKGAVLLAERVPILKNDTPETLQQRVLPVEHQVQIRTLKAFSEGNIPLFVREQPLIFPGEEKILEEAKKLAIEKYPKG